MTEKVGICTVEIDGFIARVVSAFQILWSGEMTFRVSPENFEMEGTPDHDDQGN